VALIIRDLTDEEMVGFMGRENMEDFNSDFLVQLNAWEAATKLKTTLVGVDKIKPIEIARLLGKSDTSGMLSITEEQAELGVKLLIVEVSKEDRCHIEHNPVVQGQADQADLSAMRRTLSLDATARGSRAARQCTSEVLSQVPPWPSASPPQYPQDDDRALAQFRFGTASVGTRTRPIPRTRAG